MQQVVIEGERISIVTVDGKSHWIGVRENKPGGDLDIFSLVAGNKEKKLRMRREELIGLRDLLNTIVQ